ncbi:hypothetical protein SVAN01_03622 [Stagonosporopsis vannaccii]|nr:hypothetical protein SVAN01_03622 [Stagonosporopsis vannaccii]
MPFIHASTLAVKKHHDVSIKSRPKLSSTAKSEITNSIVNENMRRLMGAMILDRSMSESYVYWTKKGYYA